MESSSANRFCQFCLIDKPNLQYIFDGNNTEAYKGEGVTPLEVKLMLPHFNYEEKSFSLEQLNERIAGFDCGYGNKVIYLSLIVNV